MKYFNRLTRWEWNFIWLKIPIRINLRLHSYLLVFKLDFKTLFHLFLIILCLILFMHLNGDHSLVEVTFLSVHLNSKALLLYQATLTLSHNELLYRFLNLILQLYSYFSTILITKESSLSSLQLDVSILQKNLVKELQKLVASNSKSNWTLLLNHINHLI